MTNDLHQAAIDALRTRMFDPYYGFTNSERTQEQAEEIFNATRGAFITWVTPKLSGAANLRGEMRAAYLGGLASTYIDLILRPQVRTQEGRSR